MIDYYQIADYLLLEEEKNRIVGFIIANLDGENVFDVWAIDTVEKKFERHVREFLLEELDVVQGGHKKIPKLIIHKFDLLLTQFSDLCTPEKVLKIAAIWLKENALSFEDFTMVVEKLMKFKIFDKVSWKSRQRFFTEVVTDSEKKKYFYSK